MRARSNWSALAFVAIAIVAWGCAGPTFVQVRPEHLYERVPGDGVRWTQVAPLEVKRSSFAVLGVPVSTPNLVAAIESGVQDANADAVTNLEVEMQLRSLFFILGYGDWTARGDLIRFQQ